MSDLRRIEVRLCDGHPGASRKEVARFKNVKVDEAMRLLAASQLMLFGTTSMWRCELRKDGRWVPFGPSGKSLVRAEHERLSKLWHPLDWTRNPGKGKS